MEDRNQRNKEDFDDFIDDSIRDEKFKDIERILSSGFDTALDFTKNSIEKVFKKNELRKPYSIQNDDKIINQKPKAEKSVIRNAKLLKISILVHVILLASTILSNIGMGNFIYDLSDLALIIVWFIPAILLSFYGLKKNKLTKDQIIRFRKYKREIGNNTVVPVRDLAVAAAKPVDFTISDLLDLINKDYFRQARIVENGELFILDSKTYKLYKEEVLNRENNFEQKKAAESVEDNNAKELLDRAKLSITQLTAMAEIIAEPMNKKIVELLSTIRKIFKHARENPNNVKELEKFIDYYLPTTVKLSKAYMDMQESNTSSMEKSLKEIEKSMDTINYASLKLLDNMYEDKAIDISSDISVLKTMLKQEGLLDSSDFNLRR